jgi:hypothetical protein
MKNTWWSIIQGMSELLVGKVSAHNWNIGIQAILHEVHKKAINITGHLFRWFKPVYAPGYLLKFANHYTNDNSDPTFFPIIAVGTISGTLERLHSFTILAKPCLILSGNVITFPSCGNLIVGKL